MSGRISNKIVTDGLVLYLDAGNTRSYVSGSTTWNDRSNNHVGTLTNGPTYDSSNGGSIVFDGVDDYGSFSASSNLGFGTGDLTIDFWMYSSHPTAAFCIFDNQGSGGASQISRIGGFYFGYNTFDVNPTSPWAYNVPTNQWVNICFSKISNSLSLYVNSTLSETRNSISAIGSGVNENRIGMRNDGFYPLNGKISNLKIYKGKGLTQAEILQNYNALKNRFGL